MSKRENYALLIGNSNYADMSNLSNPRQNVGDLAEVLQKIGFQTFVHYDATKEEMDYAILEFTHHLNANTLALVYFAGHGVQIDKENFLLPINVEVESLARVRYSAVSANYIADELYNSKSPIRIMVLDACRKTPEIPDVARHMGHGLARMNPDIGMLIAYATSEGAIAYDGAQGENSPYAKHLKNYIADTNLEAEEIFKQTRYAVYEETENFHPPQYAQQYGGFVHPVYFTGAHVTDEVLSPALSSHEQLATPIAPTIITTETSTSTTTPTDTITTGAISPLGREVTTSAELQQALESSIIIYLSEGIFELDDSLELSGDITLVGKGRQKTRILSRASDYVISSQGGGTLKLEELYIEHIGEAAAHIIGVERGSIDIYKCQVMGANFEDDWGGNGFRIGGTTRGRIRHCVVNNHGVHGIQLSDDAEVVLESNRIYHNAFSAIVYFDRTTGEARNNSCFANQRHGIVVANRATPTLRDNKIYDNNRYGVLIKSTASPRMHRADNSIYANEQGDVNDER